MNSFFRLVSTSLLLLLLAVVAGCEAPLFPEELPRTQYERYDRLRGQTRADDGGLYGSDKNLRERLRPLGEY